MIKENCTISTTIPPRLKVQNVSITDCVQLFQEDDKFSNLNSTQVTQNLPKLKKKLIYANFSTLVETKYLVPFSAAFS